MTAPAITIRPANEADLGAINDIYNHYVLHSVYTYQENPETMEDRREWFRAHDTQHPVIVALMHGQVAGWGSLSGYHERSAYRHTVENSVYVHHERLRCGIGSLLLGELIARARALKHQAIIAGIDSTQTASVALHAGFGFEKCGHLKRVGYKSGQWLDVIYMELLVGNGATGGA